MEHSGKRIAIIGAGASGIIAAKTMLEAGFEDVTVFEAGSWLGGMWNFGNDNGLSVAYRNLHINTDTYVTQLPDFPFPPGVADYAHHSEMLAYLEAYANHFGVTERIVFSTRVTSVRRAPDGDGWEVETSGEGSGTYDVVIVAAGHLNEPRWPHLPGEFQGRYLHSATYREPEPFIGQRTCIIGLGNSAMDIADDLAHVAARVVVSARTGTIIWPKYVFGYPLTRLAAKVQELPLPPKLRSRLFAKFNRALVWAVWGPMRQYGIQVPDKKTHPSSNQFFLSHVKYGRIAIKPGITGIEGRTIAFADGSAEEFDNLIAATGYTVSFPFLEPGLLGEEDTRLPLYKRVVPPEHRGLYFIGYFNIDWASNPVYEQQALLVAAIEAGTCALPSSAEMWADVRAREERLAQEFLTRPRLNLEVEYGPYVAELKRARARKPPRRMAKAGSR